MNPFDPLEGTPGSLFAERRAAVLQALGRGTMILPAAPLLYRSRDTEVPYRPDSELFYLTGVTEAGAVAVLSGGEEPRFVLFVEERNPEVELWSGPRLGPEVSRERFGADGCHPLSQLPTLLPILMRGSDIVHARLGVHPWLDRMVVAALGEARARGARRGVGPRGVSDPGQILDPLRLVKDPHEIDRIRAAVALTLEGHRAAARTVRPGVGEWAVQAAVEAAFRSRGGTGPGFGTIVGSGPNACVLHYTANDRIVGDGDLVLVDAGAEVRLYHGDVTRVFPAAGRFSPHQRSVYDVVDEARGAAVAAVTPGVTVAEIHETACRVLIGGLVSLGVLNGDVDDLLDEEAHKPFFPHQTSHWLGLDVHDPGDYATDGASTRLRAGMVLTVEPGLYFPPGTEGAGAPFAGIGIRLEDDVLVTPEGGENLTAALPTAAEAVEGLVAEVAP